MATTTTTTATNLRELHALHERAKALRDRLASAPKTIAARKAILATRQAGVEVARKAVQDEKVQIKTREHHLQAMQSKDDDLRVKLNSVRKNEEYNAISNQLAHDKVSMGKIEDEVLEGYGRVDEKAAALSAIEADVQKLADEIAGLEGQVASQAADQEAQLVELERAIVDAEAIIPPDQREHYRRIVKHRAADAFAAVEGGACSRCFVSITPQMLNELINCNGLNFCMTCGGILYLAEEHVSATRRTGRKAST